jgi:GLPGLI family protein
MRLMFVVIIALLVNVKAIAQQQRVIAECTIVYAISVDSTSTDKSLNDNLKSATKTIFIKGNNSRIDLVSAAFTQSIFYDKTKGSAIILRELGANKFITKLDSTQWLQEKQEFDSMVTTITKDTKKILGYDCKKAQLQLKNGKVYTVYFTPSLLPSVKEVDYEFKDIPGLVLAYQVAAADGKKINYTATKFNLSPVPASKFDVPSSGYRILSK